MEKKIPMSPRFVHGIVFLLLIKCVIAENWAILVSTSRFWSNYRDSTNLYIFYDTVKKMGIPDSRILVFLGEDIPCNSRNPFPGQIFSGPPSRSMPVYPMSSASRVDVRSNEVNRRNFLDLLEGRYKPYMSRDRRIAPGPDSSVFVYFSGHSAVAYTKFQDLEDVAAKDIADGFEAMRLGGRYKDLLWISDTCRAASLHNEFYSPGIIAVGSSSELDKAYSHHRIGEIGQSVIDRFSMSTQAAFDKYGIDDISIAEYFDNLDPKFLGSIPSLKTDLFTEKYPSKSMADVKISDFIGETSIIKHFKLDIGRLAISPSKSSPRSKKLWESDLYTRHDLRNIQRFPIAQPSEPVHWSSLPLFFAVISVIIVGIFT